MKSILILSLSALVLVSCNKKESKSKLIGPPGGPYKIFIVNGLSGNLSGSAGADAECADVATMYNYQGTYKAMVSSDTRVACTTDNCSGGISENTNWVLKPYTTYIQINTEEVIGTTNTSAIFDAPLSGTFGAYSNSIRTGLRPTWRRGLNCSDFSETTGTQHVGDSFVTGSGAWSETTLLSCGGTRGIYCVEQ